MRPMRSWLSRMTIADVGRAKELASRHTAEELSAMAADRLRKDDLCRLWFLVSCLIPVAVMALAVPFEAVVTAHPWRCLAALLIAMLMPLPARSALDQGLREGRIIAFAYWLKKDPLRLRGRR